MKRRADMHLCQGVAGLSRSAALPFARLFGKLLNPK
jgi:hypothetical protein